jgi:Tol biopolymer transport system component
VLAVVVLSATVLAVGTKAGATSASGRNGRVIYTQYAYGYGSLYAINPNGSGKVLIDSNAANGSWSPDGKRILFESTRKGDLDLWTIGADGSSPKELTFSVGIDQDGAYSPDGSQIAFESNRNNLNGMDVFVMNADGTSPRRLSDAQAFNGDPAWSPDGKEIAFTSSRGGSKDIWVINADGTGLLQLTGNQGTEENPAWSPDGTRIAYDSDDGEAGNLDVWVMSSNGSNQKRIIASPALDALPDWSPDSKQISFASDRSGKTERKIYIASANGSSVHLLAGAVQRGGRFASLPSWGVRPAGDSCTIEGTVHADRLTGTKAPDIICGGGGNDVIDARDGKRDVIDGGPGRDTVYADKRDVVRHVEKVLYR